MSVKFKSVLQIYALEHERFVMLPWSISSARGATFSGRQSSNCVVMDYESWSENSLQIMVDLLCLAPIDVDETLENWETAESKNTIPIEAEYANGMIIYAKGSVRAETWVKKSADDEITFGKVSLSPSWTPFMSAEIFNFFKLPTQKKFLSEMERLFGNTR